MTQVFSEERIKIHALSEDKKTVYTFDLPIKATLQEAYNVVSEMQAKILEKMEQEKKEKEPAKSKAALHKKDNESEKKEMQDKDLKETLLGKNKK